MSNNTSIEAAEELVRAAQELSAVESGGVPFSKREATLARVKAAIVAYEAFPPNEPTNLGGEHLSKVAERLGPNAITRTLLKTGKLPEEVTKKTKRQPSP